VQSRPHSFPGMVFFSSTNHSRPQVSDRSEQARNIVRIEMHNAPSGFCLHRPSSHYWALPPTSYNNHPSKTKRVAYGAHDLLALSSAQSEMTACRKARRYSSSLYHWGPRWDSLRVTLTFQCFQSDDLRAFNEGSSRTRNRPPQPAHRIMWYHILGTFWVEHRYSNIIPFYGNLTIYDIHPIRTSRISE
jgi:hypothetical protein